MKTKKLLSVVVVLTITTGAFAFAERFQVGGGISRIFVSPVITKAPAPLQKPESQGVGNDGTKKNEDVPDEVIYFVLFNHLVGLKAQAAKAAENGKSLDYLALYRSQASLDGDQTTFLFETAQNCMDEVKLIDKEAKAVIDKARAKFREREATSPDEIPVAPAELKGLQKKKDATVLRFRDVLRNGLGTASFANFDGFARNKVAPNIETNFTQKEEK